MAFRAKTYPYPVLASFTGDYLEPHSFDIGISAKSKDDSSELVLEAKWPEEKMPQSIRDRRVDGGAVFVLNVESPATFRRWVLPLDENGVANIPLTELLGEIEVTALVLNVGSLPFSPRVNDEISADYAGVVSFEVKRGDPLAIGDPWQFHVGYEGKQSNDLLKLMFDPNRTDNSYVVRTDSDQLVVVAGAHLKRSLSAMWTDPNLRPTFAMSIAKDAIVSGLMDLSKRVEDGDELEYSWQRALLAKAEDHNVDLSSALSYEGANVLAQQIVEKTGIQKLVKNVG